MKNNILFLLAVLSLGATSCKGTWLMYDTSQKDHLYFSEKRQIRSESFALISENEIKVSTNVYVMGMPADHDRTFSVEYVDAQPGDTLRVGEVTYPVISARPGVDFTVGELVIPAGEVKTTMEVTVYRQPEMLDSCYVRVGLRLKADDQFDIIADDSTRVDAVLTPSFYLYVTDGEPACPFWWRNSKKTDPGWNYSLGKYTAEKYRKLLDLYHATEQTSPVFYQYCIEHYGYYFDAEPDKDLNNEFNTFWRQTYANAWAKYVFGPLYDYYKAYYETLPENDPRREPMNDDDVNQNAQSGWGNPMYGKWAFFN